MHRSSIQFPPAFEQELEDLEEVVKPLIKGFSDQLITGTGYATAYNTRKAQMDVARTLHEEIFQWNRGLYAALLTLPGINDFGRQLGVSLLLKRAQIETSMPSLLSSELEKDIIDHLVRKLPPQRILKLFLNYLRDKKVNNARTRKLILRTLLSAEKFSFWAVKYRVKLYKALEHAWGVRRTSILRSILKKEESKRSAKERAILRDFIDRNLLPTSPPRAEVYEALGFILRSGNKLTFKQFRAFEAAKKDIYAGHSLPYEVLEGLRSTYHPDVPHETVLSLTKQNLTRGQRMNFQRKALKEGQSLEFNPEAYDPIKLYIYAFEMGMTSEIKRALKVKAIRIAKRYPLDLGRVGILVDASQSQSGGQRQQMRPFAVTLAVRDLLQVHAKESFVEVAGGLRSEDDEDFYYPWGETALAVPLVKLLKKEPEVIFILSDGYENAPAGRTGEVIHWLKQKNHPCKIYHLSSVMAAEMGTVRALADGLMPIP
ncbi:VWA domain-containing protein, partial [Magnetococcales bacterium HHB-1]